MANIIRICCVFLFIAVWLTEAYSGKRMKRDSIGEYEKVVNSGEIKNDLQISQDYMNDKLVNTEKLPTKTNDSWVDLAINFSRLARPFIPKEIYNLNLDWSQVVIALKSFEHFTSSEEKIEKSLTGSSAIETSIRAAAAATTPMIMDAVRIGLGMLLDLIDNAAFLTKDHSISRRAATEDVLDDVMAALTAVVEHFTGTGGGMHYHDIEDL